MHHIPFSFFEEGRSRFFSPLTGSRRELVAACIRTLYDRLHGPFANHTINLSKNEFKDLLLPVILDYENTAKDDVIDELTEERDPGALTQRVLKMLIQEGWLEQFADRQGLVTAFRFSRAGKLFAEALWAMDRPSRSRQRNMRGCRNSLKAAASSHGDVHDLIDALEYAEKVIQDLSDSTESLQERVRSALQAASLHEQWDSFIEFLDVFRRDISKQLTVDSAVLNRQAIREHLESLRESKGSPRYERLREQLAGEAKWVVAESTSDDSLEWLLERVEDLVCNAYDSKHPALMRAMDSYFKRITGLLQQSMLLKTGVNRKAFSETLSTVRAADDASKDEFLARIGEQIAPTGVKLLDPGSLRLKEVTRREKSSTVAITPRPSREARLATAIRMAGNEAFNLTNADIVQKLQSAIDQNGGAAIRLSMLPAESATDILTLLRGVEAARGTRTGRLAIRPVGGGLKTPYHTGGDYEICRA